MPESILRALLDDRDALAREAARLGIRVSADDSWSDLFSKIAVADASSRILATAAPPC